MLHLATNPREHRACAVCDHGKASPGECRRWSHPVRVAVARSREGHCGPDAHHLRIGGDDLAPRTGPPVATWWPRAPLPALSHGQAA